MEINVLEDKKTRLEIEIKGESHGFCNALQKSAWRVKGVTISGYNVEHPLISSPKIIIETDGKKEPKKAILDAAKKLNKDCDEFLKSFDKQVK